MVYTGTMIEELIQAVAREERRTAQQGGQPLGADSPAGAFAYSEQPGWNETAAGAA